MKRTRFTAFVGVVCCFFMIVFGIATNGGIGTFKNFINIPSLIMTCGGSVFAVMITTESATEFLNGFKSIKRALFNKPIDLDGLGNQIFEISLIARKEGLLTLDEHMNQLEDDFFKKGIRLVVDGTDPELLKDILETQMMQTMEDSQSNISFWDHLGFFSPAWGMVGTLIGLINMMKSMGTDPSSIGSGMALALITTLYGSIMANWICIPAAEKLKRVKIQEQMRMEMIIEGVLSVQAGDNPMVIKEKIRAFRSNWEEENEKLDKAA